ncbi:MAG: DUF1127 domain-containing protein [Rhodobacteraceae bacterium]|nr:DUF1127 domain-containing protein [Paracoccaceae bacterium]
MMTTTTETRSGPNLAPAFLDWWKARRAEYKRRRLLRRTRIDLSQLDDVILRDIGLTRGDVRGFDPAEHHWRWG